VRGDWEREYTEYVSGRLNALYRQAYLLTGDRHHADDLVQQTCTDLYVYWKRARDADSLDAYVRTMLIRAFLRERQRAWFSKVRLTAEVPDRAVVVTGAEDRSVLRNALGRIPPRQRAVVVLRFLYDLPVVEVAQILRCSEGTVKSQSSDGLKALRALLPEESLRGSDA
jgi:RNA polymerase sigma-70 factor (sigma-E family)